MTDEYHPTNGMTPWEQFLVAAGGGLKTNAHDFLNVVNFKRPTLEEETERARLVRPLTATPWGSVGYDIGRFFPFPPLRDYVPEFFRDNADADRIAKSKQFQAEMRAKLRYPYDTSRMTPLSGASLRGMLLDDPALGTGLLGPGLPQP